MSFVSFPHWSTLWQALGGGNCGLGWFRQLERAYGNPGRAYHNLLHLEECLAEFHAVKELAQQPLVVEMAIWFHDAVYNPHASDNEERSAELAFKCLHEDGGQTADFAATVGQLVLATKTHDAAPDTDAALLVDVDLAVLGQSWERFEEYDRSIRMEYDWVPLHVYGVERRKVLQRFLDRPRIYRTQRFFEKYEEAARCNLMRRLGVELV